MHEIDHISYPVYFLFFVDTNIRHPTCRDAFIKRMEEQLNNTLGPTEWRISHAHGYSLHPTHDEPYLYKWRQQVEDMGCKFIVTTVLRDALSHTISQLKEKMRNQLNLPMEEHVAYLGTSNRTAKRMWSTQLDYLLHNRWDKNHDLNYTMSREEKVKTGIDILRRHFDLVIYQNHTRLQEIVPKMMNVPPMPIKSVNLFPLEIKFTAKELGLLKRKIYENGDNDWINAVRHIYDDHLKYVVSSDDL